MIYFTAELQAKVLTRLHYALRPNGVMMLGKPEWTSGGEELFRQVEPEHKIFKRRVQVSRSAPQVTSGLINGRNNRNVLVDQERRQIALAQDMFDALVRAVGPNCLLVNASNQIKRIYGNVDRFVSLSEGDVRGMTLDVLRKDLRHEVRTLVQLALKNNETRSGAERQLRDESVRVQVCVYPVCTAESIEDMAIVALRERAVEQPVSVPAISQSKTTEVSELQKELTTTRQSLQNTVEELETTNEELQSLNEELQSGNEELQSTNQELETANEELQSTNEELITVNEELQINSHELSVINQELDSILSNIAAPILVVDAGLHIVRCSERARDMFRIDPAASRPHLSQCSQPTGLPDLTQMVSDVLRFGTRSEHSYATTEGTGQIIAAPYFSSKGELIGATAIISEIEAGVFGHDFDGLLDGLPTMIWQKSDDGRLLWMNAAARSKSGSEPDAAIGKPMEDLIPSLSQHGAAREREILQSMQPHSDLHEKITLPTGDTLWMSISRVPFKLQDGSCGIYVVAQDISETYQRHINRRQATDLSETILDAAPVAIEYVDAAGHLQYQNLHARQLNGMKAVGEDWRAGPESGVLIDPETDAPIDLAEHPVLRALRGDEAASEMAIRLDRDGSQNPQWTHAVQVLEPEGGVAGAIGVSVSLPDNHILDAEATCVALEGARPPLHVMDWNIRSGTIMISPLLRTLLGASEQGQLRSFDDFKSLIDPADRERFADAIDAHLTDRIALRCAFRAQPIGREGLRWLEARGQAVWDDAGRPAHLIMTLTDVTDSWHETQVLLRRSTLADMAEEAGGIASWTMNLPDKSIRLSTDAARLLSLNGRSEFSLDELLETLHRDDRTTVKHGIRNITQEAVPFSATVRLVGNANEPARIMLSGRPERDPSGQVVGVIGLIKDATSTQLFAVGE